MTQRIQSHKTQNQRPVQLAQENAGAGQDLRQFDRRVGTRRSVCPVVAGVFDREEAEFLNAKRAGAYASPLSFTVRSGGLQGLSAQPTTLW